MVDLHCVHPVDHAEPVITGGETVALICGDCLAKLPAAWGCTDCEWLELRRLTDTQPTLRLGQPCAQHRRIA